MLLEAMNSLITTDTELAAFTGPAEKTAKNKSIDIVTYLDIRSNPASLVVCDTDNDLLLPISIVYCNIYQTIKSMVFLSRVSRDLHHVFCVMVCTFVISGIIL